MAEQAGWYGATMPSIEAFLKDGSHQLFTPQVLDLMLERNQVSQFKRSNGWAIVGVDPIRIKREDVASYGYSGWERRVSSRDFPKVIR